MKTGLYQGTTLKQEMKINPRLYQAMDLLYMPLLDLQQHLKQELLNNPFLDMVEGDVEEQPEQKEEKDKEKDEDEIDWEEILLNGFETGGRREEYEDREYYEPVSVATRELADHLHDHRFWPNAFRLLLHAAAYWLLDTLRRWLAASVPQEAAIQLDTLRLRLLKIGGRVRELPGRLRLHLASSHPGEPLWAYLTAARRLAA